MTQSISMYEVLVPSATRMFQSLSAILDKAVVFAEARKIEPGVLLNSRLYVDMFPLIRQVQIATDIVKGGAARLAGQEPPSWADDEKFIDELKARIAKTVEYLQSFKPEQFEGSESRAIVLKTRNGELNFSGQDYLLAFVLPNLYFHSTTAYNILRHNGVEIGKQDYLGRR
jgi:hypothetical protein